MLNSLDDIALNKLLILLPHGQKHALDLAHHPPKFTIDIADAPLNYLLFMLELVASLGQSVVATKFDALELLFIGLS